MSTKKKKWPKVDVKFIDPNRTGLMLSIRHESGTSSGFMVNRPTARLLAKRINEALKAAHAAPAK